MTGAGPELPLLFVRRGAVALITINRPGVHNAMNPEVVCRLDDAFAAFAADPDLRAAVLTGAGDRAFCSGGDLATTLPLLTGARAPQDDWDRRVLADRGIAARAALKGVALDKPVIAAINGVCLAGGMEMMLGTDLRIAADHARFGLPEPKHGLIPFAGSLVRLPRQVPHVRAMELLLTGDMIGAPDALEFGLLNRVLPAPEVLPAALALAQRIAANGPVAIREIKRTVTATSGMDLGAAFAVETAAMDRVLATADAREGPAAFTEKRAPVFRGK